MFDKPSLFVVYVDLEGTSHGVMINCKSRADAISCVEQAWNANLLWHFKIYDDDEGGEENSVVRYATLPWDTESISKIISLARMEKDLRRICNQVESKKEELIKKYAERKDYMFVANHGDVTLYASLGVLREACTSLKAELSEQGVNVPRISNDEVLEIFEYAQNISKKMRSMEHFHGYSENNYYAASPSWYTPDQFLNSLPKLEDILASDRSRTEWLKLLSSQSNNRLQGDAAKPRT